MACPGAPSRPRSKLMPDDTDPPDQDGPSTAEIRALRLVDGLRDQATFMLGPHGHIETWSVGAQHVTGYLGDEVIGKHVSLLFVPEEVKRGEPNHELAAAEAQGQFQAEVWRVRKDGSRFPAHVVVTAMRAATGHVRGFVMVLRDLTEQHRVDEVLRRSDERFRLMVESVKDYAIFMLDPRGRVVTWNAGAERIEGYRASEIIGEPSSRFHTEVEVRTGKCQRDLDRAAEEGRYEEEGWRVRRDGNQFWANEITTALREPDGRLIGFAIVIRDLTQRRKLDDERLRLAQAEEAIRLRDEFLSIASHELKTPLTALQLQVQGLEKKVAAIDPALGVRLGRAARSGQRLADLIEALLDVSRIATGRFELRRQRFDLGEAVREVVERLRESARRDGCELILSVEDGLEGLWDRPRVEQVLNNLLTNAIRYGAGAPIEITLTAEGGEAVLRVRDNGPGIPEQDLKRIFGRFERASSMRNYGGLGLGLYVARQLIEAHGGTVSAQNPPSGGACFTVRLPRAPATAAEAAAHLH
jgi:PAS domain S-box-containing protein